MWERIIVSFPACSGNNLPSNGGSDVLGRCLAAAIHKRHEIKVGIIWMLQQVIDDGTCAFAEHIGEYAGKLEIGHGQTVLGTVLLSRHKAGQLHQIPAQVTQLPDIVWRDKASAHQIMLENVCNPFGIFLVRFLPPDGFHVFWMGQHEIAGGFKDIVDRNPVLSGRLLRYNISQSSE